MSRRKRQPDHFDVVEFLRESDGDLKSALNSLLRNPATPEDTTSVSGPKLVPAPAVSLHTSEHANESKWESGPDIELRSGLNLIPGSDLPQFVPPWPEPTSIPPQSLEPKKRRFPIREMKLAQDAHTRAEQQVYEYLWQNARTLDEMSRTITIGFGAIARMVRLSESNARINVRSLIAKLAIEEFGDYNCERSLGRTYRIFNYSQILKRRREAGLLWYMRRTLAVVFVNPTTGQPVDLGLRKSASSKPGPGPNLEPLYREDVRETILRETSSSSDSLVLEALSQYGVADDDVLKRLRAQIRNVCPDFTDEELVHFIHSKGALIRRRDTRISSPIGFLLTSLPKCFVGEAFQLFRKAQKEARDREGAERAQREAEFESLSREQQAILDDPDASEEDKKWARKMLSPDESS
jgi:hypothetical protein